MSYDAELSFAFAHTPRVVFGVNAVDDVGDLVSELGAKRAVIVTDSFLAEQTDMVERVKTSLGPRLAGVFSGVVPDPTARSVDQGADHARELQADLLISIGGGSTMDTAKGMAVVLTEGGKVLDHEGYHALSQPQTPHIAVPTTAGTGSEMTMITVITDPARGQKTFLGSFYIHPDIAVLDPTLIVGLPAKLSAATGIDAMSHAVESLLSNLRQPMSDAFALQAIRLITAYLPRSIEEPTDLVARGQMLLAAAMAGTAFSNAMVSLNHAMAHSLGAMYHIHHGTLNGLLLPHTMHHFVDAAAEQLAQIAHAMGVESAGKSTEQTARAAGDRMRQFLGEIGLTDRLRDLGVPEDGLAQAADMSLSDGTIMYSPRPVFDPQEIAAIMRNAW